jgi:AraC family transcriptional regulator
VIDYYERIELAVDFMEKNLKSAVYAAEVSAAAFSSQWHFQRIFRYLTGHSVAGYLRARRLAEAACDLVLRGRKVIDVALEYQYESPEAFARAFKKNFGVNPGEARRTDELEFFAPINIRDGKYHDVYPNVAVEERVVVRKETLVRGLSNRTSMRNNQGFHDIPRFWSEFFASGHREDIADAAPPGALLGVYSDWDYEENFDLTIGPPVSAERESPGLRTICIPAGKYAVFTIPGSAPYDLVAGWKYIYATWLPNTRLERAYGVDFDWFDERFTGDASALSDIYIPLA